MCLEPPAGVCAHRYSGPANSEETKGLRLMMAPGHRWGRESLAEGANLWQDPRILMPISASCVTWWRLSGKSRTREHFVLVHLRLRG